MFSAQKDLCANLEKDLCAFHLVFFNGYYSFFNYGNLICSKLTHDLIVSIKFCVDNDKKSYILSFIYLYESAFVNFIICMK